MARRLRMARPTPRRKKVWADEQTADIGFAEDALRSEDLLSDFVTAGGSTQGVTVARTVLDLVWTINEAHTFNEKLTIGFIKGTKATADVADPVLEPYADWAYIKTLYAGENGLVAGDSPNHLSLDVRSMRKIDEVGETWWLIFKGSAPNTATATYDVRARCRTLLILP